MRFPCRDSELASGLMNSGKFKLARMPRCNFFFANSNTAWHSRVYKDGSRFQPCYKTPSKQRWWEKLAVLLSDCMYFSKTVCLWLSFLSDCLYFLCLYYSLTVFFCLYLSVSLSVFLPAYLYYSLTVRISTLTFFLFSPLSEFLFVCLCWNRSMWAKLNIVGLVDKMRKKFVLCHI